MSNEISVITALSLKKGALVDSFPQSTLQVTMSGNHIVNAAQDVTATLTPLNMAGQSFTPGYAAFTNTDPTGSGSYVDVGASGAGVFYPMMRIYPSGRAVLPLNNITLFGKTGGGTQVLSYLILEI